MGIRAALKGSSWLFKPFPAPPAMLPEAAVSTVNLGRFKESLSGAQWMMNIETITGSVELFKTEFSYVNFCSINPDDMSNIAIVS